MRLCRGRLTDDALNCFEFIASTTLNKDAFILLTSGHDKHVAD